MSRAESWDDVSRILAQAEEDRLEENLALSERLNNPSGLALRDLLAAVLPDEPGDSAEPDTDARDMAAHVLAVRAPALSDALGLSREQLRRYARWSARGILSPQDVDRALDQSLYSRRWPGIGERFERQSDPARHRHLLESSLRSPRSGGLRLGIEPIDRLLNDGRGIAPGESCLLVGPPGSLKTALGLNALCDYVSRGGRALFLSLDMAPERVEERLLQRLMGCGTDRVRELIRTDAPEYRSARAVREAEDGRLRVMGGPMSLEAACGAAAMSGAGVVALDYVTAVDGFDSELEAVRAVTRSFRQLARRWGLTLLLLSQMSRASCQDQLQGNHGGHAMGGGSLSQFVDFEVELSRDEPDPEGVSLCRRPDQCGRFIATLCKNRSGPSGLSFEIHPDFPGLTFGAGAEPVERIRRRRAIFRPSGLL